MVIVGGTTVLSKERSVSILQKNGYFPSKPGEKQPGRFAFSLDNETFKPAKMAEDTRFMQVWGIALLSEGIRKQVKAGTTDFEMSEEKWDCGSKGVAITFIAVYAGEKKVFLTADATVPRDAKTNAARIANAILFSEEGSEFVRDYRTVTRRVSWKYAQKRPEFDKALFEKLKGGFFRVTGKGRYTGLTEDSLRWLSGVSAVDRDWRNPGTDINGKEVHYGIKYGIYKHGKRCTMFENGKIVHTMDLNPSDFFHPPSWEVQSRMRDLSELYPENPKFKEEFSFVSNWMNRDILKYAIPIYNSHGQVVMLL